MTTPTPNQPQAAVAAAIPVPAPRARRKRLRAANGIARQFAGPSGPVGHLVTGLLARGNASFNRWLVHELAALEPPPAAVIELGCGPGIALTELLSTYPAASVVGVDPSFVVLKSARRRNTSAIADGRLTLITGNIETAAGYTPADLVLACHVLYFWADPIRELRRINEILTPHGHVALGYQLRRDMPPIAQRTFPQEGFTLYDCDDQVAAVLQQAGFTPPEVRIFGDPGHPGGRLALATPRQAGRPAGAGPELARRGGLADLRFLDEPANHQRNLSGGVPWQPRLTCRPAWPTTSRARAHPSSSCTD
jgi:SAM-dependent methyltransferase